MEVWLNLPLCSCYPNNWFLYFVSVVMQHASQIQMTKQDCPGTEGKRRVKARARGPQRKIVQECYTQMECIARVECVALLLHIAC